MKSHLVSGLLFTCFAALGAFGGCVVDVDPQQAEDELGVASSEAVTPSGGGAFYTLNRCVMPFCAGYWVKEVNANATISYKADLYFSGFDEEAIRDVREAPNGEILVRGKFLTYNRYTGAHRFVVTEAYRGLPGVYPIESDIYFSAPDRRPPIVCFAAPCNNIIAKPLNESVSKAFTRMDLHRALKPMVDAAWVENMIREHDALVTGHLRDGDQLPGGHELVMDVSQVYLKLPVQPALCLMLPHTFCGDRYRATYTRDENRCLNFDVCADYNECLFYLPPKCEPGYVRKSWAIESSPCTRFVCDPEFAH